MTNESMGGRAAAVVDILALPVVPASVGDYKGAIVRVGYPTHHAGWTSR
jgi:hypothetical protein